MTVETGPVIQEAAASDEAALTVLRVVRGDPAPEELAALTAVITATVGAAAGPGRPPGTGRWAASTRVSRPLPRISPGGWSASGRR